MFDHGINLIEYGVRIFDEMSDKPEGRVEIKPTLAMAEDHIARIAKINATRCVYSIRGELVSRFDGGPWQILTPEAVERIKKDAEENLDRSGHRRTGRSPEALHLAYEPVTCPMPACAEALYATFVNVVPLYQGNLDNRDALNPSDSTTGSWKVECVDGHVVLLPAEDVGHECAPDCQVAVDHGDDVRTFRASDVDRLRQLLEQMDWADQMPQPCQPIGCDAGYHLPGCAYAEIEAGDLANRPYAEGVDRA